MIREGRESKPRRRRSKDNAEQHKTTCEEKEKQENTTKVSPGLIAQEFFPTPARADRE
jgi:hypothetical protein